MKQEGFVKKRLFVFIISLIVFPILSAYADLQTGINRLLAQARPSTNIGILIAQTPTGKILFSERSNYLFAPASALKVFTAVAALHFLKPNFRFETSLFTNGRIDNHVLQGDLIVKFTGDPELTTADLNALIGRLTALGVQSITGHVYVDNTDYSFVPYPPGSLWDDLSYGYAAPADAIIIDRNKFVLYLEPSKQAYGRPRLSPVIPAGVANFINGANTVKHAAIDCPLTIYSDLTSTYHISGCISNLWAKQQRTLAIRDPFVYATVLITEAFQHNHINYTGRITHGTATQNMTVLAAHQSPVLATILHEMLKKSDNLTTNSLLKKMGQLYFKQPGSWKNGLLAMKNILAPTGVNFKQCLINDGAGLSRYNLITPAQFISVLNFAYRDATIRDALWPALPIAGIDGTLAGRMQPVAAGGRVHAKTGTMTGISALAGYVNTKHHGMLSFVIMINGFIGKDRPFKHLQDLICEYLINA